MTAFKCIYCLRSEPDVRPSKAHIFPSFIGGVTTASDTVCAQCNTTIGRAMEAPSVRTFAFFNLVFGIKGRRKRIKGVPAVVRVEGRKTHVTLGEKGQLVHPIVFAPLEDAADKTWRVMGPSALVAQKREEINRKHPNVSWKDEVGGAEPIAEISFDVDLAGSALRRLAAKVAFERWAQCVGQLVTDPEYKAIRSFVLHGAPMVSVVGILDDSYLLEKMAIPVPCHAVAIIQHPKSRVLGAFVTFYGLFTFWVLLSSRYTALGAWDRLLLEHPQTGEAEEPRLRGQPTDIVVEWQRLVAGYEGSPDDAQAHANRRAKISLTEAAERYYSQRKDDVPQEETQGGLASAESS